MDYVNTYLRLEDKAVKAEGTADEARYEQCRISHEAITEGGYTQTGFAKSVRVHQSIIHRRASIWAKYGVMPLAARPAFGEAWAESVGSTQAQESTRKQVSNAKTVLADPVSTHALLMDPATRANVERELHRIHLQMFENQRTRTPEAVEAREESAAVMAGLRAVRALRECVRGLSGIRPNARLREDLAEIIEQVGVYVEFLEAAAEARSTLTDEVEEFLAGIAEG